MPSREAARHGTTPDVTDRLAFERIRTGDAAAFESLVRAHAASLASFAHAYVDSGAIAEELVQDLFCWLWDHRFETPVPRSVRAYLFGSLRNRALNHLRHQRVTIEFEAAVARTRNIGAPSADEELLAADLTDALQRAVREMPVRCREVFTLVRDEHLTYAEVAEVLGISSRTVEIHMSRALTLLRTRLAPWLG
ncbi:MAG: RNA polymerase sigma-70 factor [Gemmatimonadaceae bacterium]